MRPFLAPHSGFNTKMSNTIQQNSAPSSVALPQGAFQSFLARYGALNTQTSNTKPQNVEDNLFISTLLPPPGAEIMQISLNNVSSSLVGSNDDEETLNLDEDENKLFSEINLFPKKILKEKML